MSANDSAIAELRAQVRIIQELLDSAIWKQYSSMVAAQCEGRTNELILSPLATLDGALAQEYAKGEIAGMRFAIQMLPQLVDDTMAEINGMEPNDE